MTLYNNTRFLPEAIESLLNQTYQDFKLVVVDDASTDDTSSIMESYVRRDSRIVYYRNPRNLGQVKNFRLAFEKAQRTVNGLDYYGWTSEHDVWHPDWLRAHVETLNEHPDVVLAYPIATPIGPDGEELPLTLPRFETYGMNQRERVRSVCLKMKGAGNMIYGLFRADALLRTSIYPRCLMPDRLVLMEMSVYGTYKQIEQPLWYRRYPDYQPYGGIGTLSLDAIITRQQSNSFGGSPPFHSNFPILTHAALLVYYLSLRPPTGSYANARLGPYMAFLWMHRRRSEIKAELKSYARKLLQGGSNASSEKR